MTSRKGGTCGVQNQGAGWGSACPGEEGSGEFGGLVEPLRSFSLPTSCHLGGTVICCVLSNGDLEKENLLKMV